MPLRPQQLDPYRNFKYEMRIIGFGRAGWSRIGGLKETTEVVEYREGTDPARMRKLFGQTSFDNVTCERGMTQDVSILDWRRLITNVAGNNARGQDGTAEGNAVEGSNVRREVNIFLREYHGRLGWQWTLAEAWPTSLEWSEFGGDGNEVVLETMELVHEGMSVLSGVAVNSQG